MNCTGETLTATLTGVGQRATSDAARSSTHSPSDPIRPMVSATGMNSLGPTRPRAGWRQYKSASTPMIALVRRSTWG